MDIRRISLWEGRNATYISNDLIKVIIEDQGEITLELSALNSLGGRINAFCIPYFRGREAHVIDDPNLDWWKSKQRTYVAGGSYINFPNKDEDNILASTSSWAVKRYGSENIYGGLWKLSEIEENNKFNMQKIDLLLPNQSVLYSLIKIDNLTDEELSHQLNIQSMLSTSFLESSSFFTSSSDSYVAHAPNYREVAFNRIKSGEVFSDLKKAPSIKGGTIDSSYYPGLTGSYDYLQGSMTKDRHYGYNIAINPKSQMIYLSYFPSVLSSLNAYKFNSNSLALNFGGRMDSPWALYEGGTPQLSSITAGFGSSSSISLQKKESITVLYAQAFLPFDNPRMGLGYHSIDFNENEIVLKRAKSSLKIAAEVDFKTILSLSDRLLV